jgi:hypothetical protein
MEKKIESLVSFFNEKEFEQLEKKRAKGWYITYLTPSSGGYTVVLEKCNPPFQGIYIPPRKKLRIK